MNVINFPRVRGATPIAADNGAAVRDERLKSRQRDAVEALLAALAEELRHAGRRDMAMCVAAMANAVVTAGDADLVAGWLDTLGARGASGDCRSSLYAAALRLRQLAEV